LSSEDKWTMNDVGSVLAGERERMDCRVWIQRHCMKLQL